MTSFEHLNPWYDYNFTQGAVTIRKDDSFHHIQFANKKNWTKMRAYWASWANYPVARLMCGNGLSAWILIILLGYAIRTHSRLSLLGLAPNIFLLVGLFMSHVNGLLRYGYPLIAASPLICAYVLYIASKRNTIPVIESPKIE